MISSSGTGAAPLEFSNSVGMPARDAWVFVHNALVGVDLREEVKLIGSGKIISGFHSGSDGAASNVYSVADGDGHTRAHPGSCTAYGHANGDTVYNAADCSAANSNRRGSADTDC